MQRLDEILTKLDEAKAMIKENFGDLPITVSITNPQPFISPLKNNPLHVEVKGDLVFFGEGQSPSHAAIYKDGEIRALIEYLCQVEAHMQEKFGKQNKDYKRP